MSKYNWLSSLKKSHIEKHKTNEEPIEIEVDSITLNDLFDKHDINKIDVLFVDSEGMDDKLIMSIDFNKFDIEFNTDKKFLDIFNATHKYKKLILPPSD